MPGIAILLETVTNKPGSSCQILHSCGLFSAAVAASSAAACFARGSSLTSRYLFRDFGVSVAYADAGALWTDEHINILSSPENSYQPEYSSYSIKEYTIDLKPVLSAFRPKSLALTSLRSFLMFFLPLLEPKFDNDDDDDDDAFLSDHIEKEPADFIIPLQKSVRQIILETTIVTVRRILERFAVHYVSKRVAWKLLKDSARSAKRKAGRGLPIFLYSWSVTRTTFRGHMLGVTASWLVQVGMEIYHVFPLSMTDNGEVIKKAERAKLFRKNVVAVTIGCCSSLIFASIGAGICANLFYPSIGQQIGCAVGDFVGPNVVVMISEKLL